MNWYFYWYFTIYSIYKRFSRDRYFDIFATSMFSFFVTNLLSSLIFYLSFCFDSINNIVRSSSLTIIIPGISVFFINYYIFLPKRKQLRNYNKYIEEQNIAKTVVSILLSIFSVVLLFFIIIQLRNSN